MKTLARKSGSAGTEMPIREIAATKAKNRFGSVLAKVEAGEVVAIVRHNKPMAVVLPMSEYQRLSSAASRKLNLLTSEFDALLERMQSKEVATAMAAAFNATPAHMSKAAVAAARRRHG